MTPDKACHNKNFYDTEWEATHQAALQRAYSGHDNILPYKCPFCTGWHIGHSYGWPKSPVRVDCQYCKARSMTPKNYDRHYRKVHKYT